ncbi:hypothetical protein [Hymenobacter seoulensis]
MIKRILPLAMLLAGFQTSVAQVITDQARATTARDSLMQVAAATRAELLQRTGFIVKAPRMGARRHIIRGYVIPAYAQNLPENRSKRNLVWEQKTVYRRNGQVAERYVARLKGQPVLRERRLNGTTLWLSLNRPQNLAEANGATSNAIYGTYVRDGYFNLGSKRYLIAPVR